MVPGGSSTATARTRMGSDVAVLALVVAVSFALGAVTAYAQGFLPDELGSLANSVGTWGLVAFGLALLGRRPRIAGLAGALSLAALVVGYYTTNELRGAPASSRTVVFWLLAAATAGPAIGISAHWVRRDSARRAALGVGLLSGVLIGEGIYGLTVIADTTYPPYWAVELACGVVALVVVAASRLRSARETALAVGTAAVIATAFVVLFSQDLLALL